MMTATKLADLQTEGQKHVADAQSIRDGKGDPSEWDDQTKADYTTAITKAQAIREQVKAAKADIAILEQTKLLSDEIGIPDVASTPDVRQRVKSLGLQVVESAQFKSLMAPFGNGRGVSESMRLHSDPIEVKSIIRSKGLITGASDTSGGALIVNDQSGIVEMLGRKTLTIRDLVTVRRTTSDAVEYVEQTSTTNNAAVVAEATSSAAPTAPGSAGALVNVAGGGYKPESDMALVRRTAPVRTIANWIPATKRSLADLAALEGLINDELAANVAEAEEAQILNGSGSGENFTGINNWSGIQTQAFSTDLFQSIRKGITKARTVGRVNPTAIVVSPATAEVIDLDKDLNGAYRYGGPQYMGARTVWGVPVVESETQPDGFALLGDFSKAVIWDREATTVTMTDTHADFFVRNLVAILAEERLAFAVTRPKAFVNVDIAA